MTTVRVGLDLAKNVFQVHGVDEHEAVTFRKQIRRAQRLLCSITFRAYRNGSLRRLSSLGTRSRRLRA